MSPESSCEALAGRGWRSASLSAESVPHWFSFKRSPDPVALATLLSGDTAQCVRARQVHGARCVDAAECLGAMPPEADSIASNSPELIPTVATADCVPVLLWCPRSRSVAAVHAGWRGIVAGVIESTLSMMAKRFGASPAAMWAALGPCAGVARYEVGLDVISAFTTAGLSSSLAPAPRSEKAFADCSRAAATMLVRGGVPRASIDISGICTIADTAYASHRREPSDRSRMIAAISIPR